MTEQVLNYSSPKALAASYREYAREMRDAAGRAADEKNRRAYLSEAESAERSAKAIEGRANDERGNHG